jgi:hypothetical protein
MQTQQQFGLNDAIDPMFLVEHVASERTVESQQGAKPAKEGCITVSGTLASYLVKPDEKKSAVAATAPGQVVKKKKRDNPKMEYNAKIQLLFRVTKFFPEPDLCLPRDDGQPGWKVLGAFEYFTECKAFLKERGPRAWAVDPAIGTLPSDPLSVRIREYVAKDGIRTANKWFYVSVGDEITASVTDSEKNNVFRQDNPLCPGTLLVQPDTPLTLQNVELRVYVNNVAFDVEVKDGTRHDDAGTDEAQPVVPTLSAAVDDTTTEVKKKGPTRREERIMEYPRYSCTSARISEDYDATKALSERKHETQNPYAHNMVPIGLVKQGTVKPPKSVYFYVQSQMQTAVLDDSPADMPGVTLIRFADKDSRDFKAEFNNVVKADSRIRFNVYQWRGKPSLEERYIVSIETIKKSAEFWRAYGITDIEPYERIIGANIELPLHVHADLWWNRTVNHLSNDPLEMGPTPHNIARKTANVCGYYTYIMKDLVPDFLRFFRSGKALRLSRAFVADEFSNWTKTNKKTGRDDCRLAAPPGPANPVNLLGIASPVIALGNGKAPADDANDAGPYVAFPGHDLMPMFTGDTHDFYVLTSHILTAEQRARYCSMLDRSVVGDALLGELKTLIQDLHYWIYAVRRDAKMAGQQVRVVASAPPTVGPGVGSKRQHPGETGGDGGVAKQKEEEDDDAAEAAAAEAAAAEDEQEDELEME